MTRPAARFRLLTRLYLAVVVALVVAVCGQAIAATLYVIGQPATGNSANQATSFGTIDTLTGSYTQISANILSGSLAKNLAYNPTTQQFYTSGLVGINSDLRTLSTSGSISAPIGVITKDPGAMWYNATTGTLSIYNRTNQQVGPVSTTTGSFTNVAASTTNFNNLIGGRGALLSGTNFMISPKTTASASQFGFINLTTGSFTQLTTGTDFQYMVLATDGTKLYGVVPNSTSAATLYSINTTTGSLTLETNVTGTSIPIQFSGASFAVVPEPSTIVLALSGVVAITVGMRSRRRKKTPSAV